MAVFAEKWGMGGAGCGSGCDFAVSAEQMLTKRTGKNRRENPTKWIIRTILAFVNSFLKFF
jgi:hypothetical protein